MVVIVVKLEILQSFALRCTADGYPTEAQESCPAWASTLPAHCYHQQTEHTHSVTMGICSILVLTLVVLCLLRETWFLLLFNFSPVLVTGIYFSFEEISIAKECLIDNKKRKWCWWVLKRRFTVEVCSCLGSQFLFRQDVFPAEQCLNVVHMLSGGSTFSWLRKQIIPSLGVVFVLLFS